MRWCWRARFSVIAASYCLPLLFHRRWARGAVAWLYSCRPYRVEVARIELQRNTVLRSAFPLASAGDPSGLRRLRFSKRSSAAGLLWRRTGVFLLLQHIIIAVAWAEPWENYGRSIPSPHYEQDDAVDSEYEFGKIDKAFHPYHDPDINQARSLPNPLLDPAFDSYRLIIIVNKDNDEFWGRAQTLRVYQRGSGLIYYWLISTGGPGFETPSGYFIPQGFSSRHWSGPYDAPMLWSVFFNGGISLHASLDREALYDMGRAADSHGCVHVEDHRAEELYHLIGQSGYGQVDALGRNSGRPLTSGKTRKKIGGYKTLIIVSPIARYRQSDDIDSPLNQPQQADESEVQSVEPELF